MGPVAKIVLSTWLFSAIHSLFASNLAKRMASRLIGEENRNRYYRVFFNAQSVISSVALVWYMRALPNKTVWRMNRSGTALCSVVRTACLVGFLQAVWQIGFRRVSGLESLLAEGGAVPREPEAQGPALDRPVTGPFRFSRHPLNFLAIPLIWLAPRMTRNRFAFNCVATIYFVLGSLHEEQRMREAWRGKYHQYKHDAPFMFGVRGKRIRRE